jgi:hypothetical protein
VTDIETRLASLEARVEYLEGNRSGRRPLPIIVSVDGICGAEPDIDSSTCPHASLYRRQKGCKGLACKREASEYYTKYRAKDAPVKVRKRKR